jgi:Family of unknown function (DUF5871)
MSSIVCPSNFSAKNIAVSAPRQLQSGAKQANLSYAGERLIMQTALSMSVPFGLNIADKFGPPEYSVDLSFRGVEQRPELKEFQEVMAQLDETLINEGVKNSKAWFKADLGREVIKAFYTPSLKFSKDKEGNLLPYPPTIKLKLRKYDGQFETKFYDVNGKPYRDVPIEDLLVKGVQVTAIMECGGVWFAGSKFGLTWKAKQIAIHKLPEKMGDFAFRGLSASSAASASASSSANDEDKSEVDDDAVFASASSSAPRSVPSVVAALLPQPVPAPAASAPAPAAPSAVSEEPESAAESVSDEAGDDVEPVPAPRKGPIIKKKVVAPKK